MGSVHYSILKHALGCGKSAMFRRLKLNREYPDAGRFQFMNDLCNGFAWYIDPDYKKICEKFDNDYLPDLFSLPSQYETAKNADLIRAKRAVDFFIKQGYQFVRSETFQVPLNCEVYGTMFDNVMGGCFVFKKQDAYAAFMVKNSVPAYSKQARRPERKVHASPELLLTILGLSEKYPGLSASILYLNVENEKESKMTDVLPGKNVVTLKVSKEDAEQLLNERLSLPEYVRCDDCSYADLCLLNKKEQYTEHKDKPLEEAKEKRIPVSGGTLTKAQQQIVSHREGPLCCIAVPGAGKTHSLVKRLGSMVNDGISPKNILFITFTRKAAKEIEERVERLLGTEELPTVSTFHSFAMKVIRESADERYRKLRLAETLEQRRLIERVLKEQEGSLADAPRFLYGRYGLLDYVGKAFQYYEKEGEAAFLITYCNRDAEKLLKLYHRYKECYEAEGYISYDEMVPVALQILREHPDELLRLQNRYQYLMADEFQDVSPEQAELLYLLAKNRNIVVVGDDDQMIYSWRGGTNEYLLNFLNDWPDGTMVRMEDNFRSVDKILAAAEELIFQNVKRIPKQIIPHKEGELRPVFLKNCIPKTMPRLLYLAMKNGYKPGDIAVLARKNAELDRIAEELYRAGIPYLEPKECLVSDDMFLQLYDILSLYYKEMRDDVALYRTFARVGCSFEEELTGEGSLYERMVASFLMPEMDNYTTEDEYRAGLEKIGVSDYGLCAFSILKCFKAILYGSSVRKVLEEIASHLELERKELDAVDTLVRKAEEKNILSVKELYAYMRDMVVYQDDTDIEYPEEEGKVNLLSCHKAKGKEYPLVIVYGVESFKDTDEDRCVLYVAMTRAKKCLYLTEGPFGNAELFQELDEDHYIVKEVAV